MVEKILTTGRIAHDPDGRSFLDHVDAEAPNLGIADGLIYYDFPTYADYDAEAHHPDFLLLTRGNGVVAIKFAAQHLAQHEAELHASAIDRTLSAFSSILIGRLLKSRMLRSSRSALKFQVTPVIVWLGFTGLVPDDLESEFANSFETLFRLISELNGQPISEQEFAEARSIIEGAKALTRPHRRIIEDPARESKAVALATLESEIANFDERQRQTALSIVQGPQRIRGLAGSGKTVILAMKAAHLHIADPEANILVTFYTRSLQATLEVLITRFYRHYKDEDPDWLRIHVRHGWGGSRRPGVYSEACLRHGVPPLAFAEARRASADPFDYACRDLLRRVPVAPYYDFVLVDEGQDFPSGFYELVFSLATNDRDRKNIIWAYDELQNILDVKIRSPHELFGTDGDGSPRIDLERAASHLPQGIQNDIVLSKCYRNQREILVVAHALGFGLYGNIVQLLQDEEHWNDVGYEVHSGPLVIGQPVRIFRPAENSPMHLGQEDGDSLVDFAAFDQPQAEVEWIVSGIQFFIEQGLRPEDILVISLDDRNARHYFRGISSGLSDIGIASNNIIADPYTEPPFTVEGKVTLSTVYRAKGNEAAVVFALGIDAISGGVRAGRNKLFTAFTRSKAWLRVSGYGANARRFGDEIEQAKAKYPYLEFVMPDPARIETIQRDLSKKAAKAKKLRDEYVNKLKRLGISEEELTDLLEVEDKEIAGSKSM